MQDKKNNNLVCVEHPDSTKHYFTSSNRAAKHINAHPVCVEYALKTGRMARDVNGGQWVVYFVDGSEIKYKDINI